MSGGYFDYKEYHMHDIAEYLLKDIDPMYHSVVSEIAPSTAELIKKLADFIHIIDYDLSGDTCIDSNGDISELLVLVNNMIYNLQDIKDKLKLR